MEVKLGIGSVQKARAGVDPRDSLPGDEIAPTCMQSLHARQTQQKEKEQLL